MRRFDKGYGFTVLGLKLRVYERIATMGIAMSALVITLIVMINAAAPGKQY